MLASNINFMLSLNKSCNVIQRLSQEKKNIWYYQLMIIIYCQAQVHVQVPIPLILNKTKHQVKTQPISLRVRIADECEKHENASPTQ